MNDNNKSWLQLCWRITSCHMVSYFVVGIIASALLNYKTFFAKDILAVYMRPIESPWVAAGPLLQVFRGILFTLVLWPVRNFFLEDERGIFRLWLIFLGLAILGTAGPSPGSFEGIIYTQLPIQYHFWGLPEVIAQTFLFSSSLVFWYRRPVRTWNIIMVISVTLIALMSIAGVFLRN